MPGPAADGDGTGPVVTTDYAANSRRSRPRRAVLPDV